jgi:hypothetical protein
LLDGAGKLRLTIFECVEVMNWCCAARYESDTWFKALNTDRSRFAVPPGTS